MKWSPLSKSEKITMSQGFPPAILDRRGAYFSLHPPMANAHWVKGRFLECFYNCFTTSRCGTWICRCDHIKNMIYIFRKNKLRIFFFNFSISLENQFFGDRRWGGGFKSQKTWIIRPKSY